MKSILFIIVLASAVISCSRQRVVYSEPGISQFKTYTIDGVQYGVSKKTTTKCPSGGKECIHGHMPERKTVYRCSSFGVLFTEENYGRYPPVDTSSVVKHDSPKRKLIRLIYEDNNF